MNKIKDSISTSSFGACPLPITQKIIQESFNPRVREVCKIFNKLFGDRYVNFIIKNLDDHDIKDLTIKELLIAQDNLFPNSNDFINLRNFFYGIRNHSPNPKSFDIADDICEQFDFISTGSKNLNYILEYEAVPPYYEKIKLSNIIPELRQGIEDTNLIQMCIKKNHTGLEFQYGINEYINRDDSVFGPEFVKKIASEIRNNIKPSENVDIKTLSGIFSFKIDKRFYCGTLFFVPIEILNFKNATSIKLRNNSLFYVPEQFSELTNLTDIDLSGNYIKELNFSFERLTRLIGLEISENKIKKLPESIVKAERLADIIAYENEIEELPENLGNLKCLKVMCLSKNRLQHLPRSIGELKNLQLLNLDHNHLCSVPDFLVKLTALQVLNLSYTNLEKLPDFLVKLTALEILNLSYNNLEKLPQKMGLLNELTELDISYNKLTELPSSVARLTRLKDLHVYGNSDSLTFSGGTLEDLSSSLPNLGASSRLFLKAPAIKLPPPKRERDIGDSEKEIHPSKVQRNGN